MTEEGLAITGCDYCGCHEPKKKPMKNPKSMEKKVNYVQIGKPRKWPNYKTTYASTKPFNNWTEEKDMMIKTKKWKKLKKYLLSVHKEYSERNGLPYCKNCGIDAEELISLIEEICINQ